MILWPNLTNRKQYPMVSVAGGSFDPTPADIPGGVALYAPKTNPPSGDPNLTRLTTQSYQNPKTLLQLFL